VWEWEWECGHKEAVEARETAQDNSQVAYNSRWAPLVIQPDPSLELDRLQLLKITWTTRTIFARRILPLLLTEIGRGLDWGGHPLLAWRVQRLLLLLSCPWRRWWKPFLAILSWFVSWRQG